MSSFKKLRLDPDTPVAGTSKNLLNQPGANDSSGGSGRGSYVDNSSFSSSTSGGSGTCMRSAGPFRTRYSQPLRISSPSSGGFSRFAPYYFGRERRSTLRVPLIRARRDESDSESNRPSSRASLNSSIGGDSTSSASAPVTTSTAQRIIETLQKLSTPVMNAGKIRIDQDISKFSESLCQISFVYNYLQLIKYLLNHSNHSRSRSTVAFWFWNSIIVIIKIFTHK